MTFAEISANIETYGKQVAAVVGFVSITCTAIGNPIVKFASGKFNTFGQFLVAFGVDMGKARKRLLEGLAKPEPETTEPDEEKTQP